jgi:hypothetical protein
MFSALETVEELIQGMIERIVQPDELRLISEKGVRIRKDLISYHLIIDRIQTMELELADLKNKISGSSPFCATAVAIEQSEHALRGILVAAVADQQDILHELGNGSKMGTNPRTNEVTRIPDSWVPGKALIISFRGVQVCVRTLLNLHFFSLR